MIAGDAVQMSLSLAINCADLNALAQAELVIAGWFRHRQEGAEQAQRRPPGHRTDFQT